MSYVWVPILIAILFLMPVVIFVKRHLRDHREELEPVLVEHGYKFVSSRWPGPFKTGPFPLFEVEVGVAQSHKMGVRGEYDTYRLVVVQDESGQTHTIWACIVFESFQVRKIRWRVANDVNVPAGLEDLLEQVP
ncbi:MAG: hypothetical protein AAGC44_14295 [Planctomycetota bacterium]